ncbi:uncharacterized protein [Aegilops tauschii subsp. strangulata]|uniref:uncharacterized protein n=1 Tax=Aegilops tauschii subsp. strangulata TaxID=200361 RepID=UPI003CC86025
MAAAMPPRLIAVAALVTLMCAVAVAQVPAAGGAPVCLGVDRNVVNACFKTFGEDYETDTAAAQFDYGVDDPSYLPEQPDVGVQEPDATVDDDTYDTGGAYYYVQPADDDQE